VPVWAAILIGVGIFLVMAALAVGGFFAWQAYQRRVLLTLLGRTEAIESVASALIDVISRLAQASDDELEEFVSDTESTERRALHEVASRARMLADELDTMPLPKSLVQLTEALGDAAYLVASEAARVTDDRCGAAALEDLAGIDLGLVRGYTRQARYRLTEACERHGMEETSVYGGGLYL